MVTSVNGNSLAALTARDNALAGRTSGLQNQGVPADGATGPDQAVVYAGSSEAPNLSAVLSVQDSLNRAAGVSDVGVSAGQTIADLLSLVREKVSAAQGAASPEDKSGLDADYQQLLQTIDQIASSASFQGVKMLDGSSSGDLQFKADVRGDTSIAFTPHDLTVGGPVLGLAGTDLLGTSDDIAGVLGQVDAASAAVGARVSQMTAQGDQIQGHLGVVGQLQSALSGQAPADLDADGARLQALQIQQALAGQGTGIVNQGPQALLSLFRS